MATPDRIPAEPRPTGATNPPDSTPGLTDKLQDTASRVADTVQDAAAPVLDQASERVGEVADQVKDQATSRLDTGKAYAVETLTGVAQALRQTGQHLREEGSQPTLGRYADSGAQQLERFTGYLRERDTNQLLSEAESYARRNPTIFAGGAFALGLLAARFFRSSGQRSRSGSMAGGAPSGRFSPLTPSGQSVPDTGTTPGPATGQSSGGLSAAPAARNIPASPERTPSTPGGPSTSPRTGTQDPPADQRTPTPGSLPSQSTSTGGPGRPSPADTPGSQPGNPSTRPEPGTGGTSRSPDRPQPGSRPPV